jgi:hypothetical protein
MVMERVWCTAASVAMLPVSLIGFCSDALL